jgi:molecular chaperone GrpE
MSDNDEQNTTVKPESAEHSQPEGENVVEETKRKAAENWDLFLRARADVENVQRRARADIENAHKFAIERFARELLTVADSLEHGLAASEKEIEAKALREGMELTYKMLLDVFEKFGIKILNPVNETFDPKYHEAVSTQPTKELEPNKIMMVVQKGFTLNDRMLRPARVIVSRAAEA